MNIKLKFKNINSCNGVPELKISVNGIQVYDNLVQPEIEFEQLVSAKDIMLVIEHYNKNPDTDTLVDNNFRIVKDKNCELDSIIIDEYDIEELKWQSYYLTCENEKLEGCLFFGKNGKFYLNVSQPILKWILRTRNEILNNDPDWEQDYESYISACKLLNKLKQ